MLTQEIEEELGEEYAVSSIKLTKDLREAALQLKGANLRYIVDRFYQLQRDRTRADHQAKESATPNALLTFSRDHAWKLECTLKLAMKYHVESKTVGAWLLSVHGIGPVLSAGLLAHLDVTKAKSAASFWRFAGLDPTVVWEGKAAVKKFVLQQIEASVDIEQALVACAGIKGRSVQTLMDQATMKPDGTANPLTADSLTKALSRQPWNARLKVLCWKAALSFVRQSSSEKCYYGKLYRTRKAREVAANEAGEYAAQARTILTEKNFDRSTIARKAYEEGRLPDGHIDMRARRMVEKLFLSHIYQVMFEEEYGKPAAIPYVFAFADHDFNHYLRPPNWRRMTQ